MISCASRQEKSWQSVNIWMRLFFRHFNALSSTNDLEFSRLYSSDIQSPVSELTKVKDPNEHAFLPFFSHVGQILVVIWQKSVKKPPVKKTDYVQNNPKEIIFSVLLWDLSIIVMLMVGPRSANIFTRHLQVNFGHEIVI